MSTINYFDFYSRQIKLDFVGIDGQEKLKNSKVLIVGAGGLGTPITHYLSSSGVGTLGIIDFDYVSLHNLHRQNLYKTNDINQKKSDSLIKNLIENNPFTRFINFNLKLDSTNIEKIIKDFDIIIDGSDNLETKFILHEFSFMMKKILIQGSIDKSEGELRTFDFRKEKEDDQKPCFRCLWPKLPSFSCVNSCAENGVLPTTAGFFGMLMANETIKIILDLPSLPNGTTYSFNLVTLEQHKFKWKKNSECPLCVHKKNEFKISNYGEEFFLKSFESQDFIEIDVTLKMLLPTEIKKDQKYLLKCKRGIRSIQNVRSLREEGFLNVWAKEINYVTS